MKKFATLFLIVVITIDICRSQTTAMQVTRTDCGGNPINLLAELDSGRIVILFFFMPNCNACPPVAKKVQAMAENLNAEHPDLVKGYAFPYDDSPCSVTNSWLFTNDLGRFYIAGDTGTEQVSYYGGFSMPTVVVLGGDAHKVIFTTTNSPADTSQIKDSISALLNGTTSVPSSGDETLSFEVSPTSVTDNFSVTLELNMPSRVFIDLTDIAGRQVKVLLDEFESGIVKQQFSNIGLPSGAYIIRCTVKGKTVTKKFILQ